VRTGEKKGKEKKKGGEETSSGQVWKVLNSNLFGVASLTLVLITEEPRHYNHPVRRTGGKRERKGTVVRSLTHGSAQRFQLILGFLRSASFWVRRKKREEKRGRRDF